MAETYQSPARARGNGSDSAGSPATNGVSPARARPNGGPAPDQSPGRLRLKNVVIGGKFLRIWEPAIGFLFMAIMGAFSFWLFMHRISRAVPSLKSVDIPESPVLSEKLPDTAKSCDFSQGKWVQDSRRPLYSGLNCKFLAAHWACRRSKRPSYDYEQWSWKPDNCDLPLFDRQEFFQRMQHKTLAFIGDSLGQQQFQSMMCLLSGFQEDIKLEDVGEKYGLLKAPGEARPSGYAYVFTETNTTVLFRWSSCLCELEEKEPKEVEGKKKPVVAMHLDRPDTFLKKYFDQFDVIVLNTGHHWNREKMRLNGWEFYANDNPVPQNSKKAMTLSQANQLTMNTVMAWIDNLLQSKPTEERPKVFSRTLSTRHFMDGEWNSGGRCDHLQKMLTPEQVAIRPVRDVPAEISVNNTLVHLLNVTYMSQFRGEAHPSNWDPRLKGGQDCLHWCMPGVPDIWNELVFAHLIGLGDLA